MTKSIIEFCAVFAVSVLHHVIGSYFYSKRADYPKSFTVTENLLRYWGNSIAIILVVLLVAFDQPDKFASIGILTGYQAGDKNTGAILIGISFVSILLIFVGVIQRIFYRVHKTVSETKSDLANSTVIGISQHRDTFELLAYLSVLPFVVIAEDLAYRGYLVLMLGNRTQTFIPWIILSISLSVIIHLYQGQELSKIISHAISAAILIGLIITTGNILAPIGAHLFYDFMWTIQTWKKVKSVEPQPEIVHSRKKKVAYTTFIICNFMLLYISWLIVSYAK